VNEEPERSGGNKRFATGKKLDLAGDAKENIILVLVEKFLGWAEK